MVSAVVSVLENYELLEHVLVQLPLRDLFVVQRVSSTWNALIGRSSSIQKKMFLAADGTPMEPMHDARPESVSEMIVTYESQPRLNPVLTLACLDCGGYSRKVKFGDVTFHCSQHGTQLQFTLRRLASEVFRSTLLCQPPVTAVTVFPDYNPAKILHNAAGVKIADVCDAFDDLDPEEHGDLTKMAEVVVDLFIDVKAAARLQQQTTISSEDCPACDWKAKYLDTYAV